MVLVNPVLARREVKNSVTEPLSGIPLQTSMLDTIAAENRADQRVPCSSLDTTPLCDGLEFALMEVSHVVAFSKRRLASMV